MSLLGRKVGKMGLLVGPGDRIGAIARWESDKVCIYGYGVYEADKLPPPGTLSSAGVDLSQFGETAKLRLDNGDVIWNGQCWWGPEEWVKQALVDKVVAVLPAEGP